MEICIFTAINSHIMNWKNAFNIYKGERIALIVLLVLIVITIIINIVLS